MEKIQFLVQGSEPNPYEVMFEFQQGNLIAICSCPAGRSGTGCKHRFSIFEGDATNIVSNNAEQIKSVSSWLAKSNLVPLMEALELAGKNVVLAKKQESDAKKKLAQAMIGKL